MRGTLVLAPAPMLLENGIRIGLGIVIKCKQQVALCIGQMGLQLQRLSKTPERLIPLTLP